MRLIPSLIFGALLFGAATASAQPAPPPPPQPPPGGTPEPPPAAQPAPPPPAPQPDPTLPPPQQPPVPQTVPQAPPPQGFVPQQPQTYAPPNGPPPPQGYAPYGYGVYPPAGPPPPPLKPKEPGCCRFAIRFDPFDLLFRRLSFQTELKLWGPLSIEAEPSWIFGSATENLDIKGGALTGNFLVYFTGRALNGFYAKAIVGFEKYTATLTDPELQQTAEKDLASPILGVAIGSSNVFGDEFGFNLAGGVGVGFATAEQQTLRAGRYEVSFYDETSFVQLLASLGLGFAF